MYDIIGDLHGHANSLTDLLTKMGYEFNGDFWSHPTRKAIFAGDYIDRGPYIRQTVKIIKEMCDNDVAYAIMGNHEFNAISYCTKGKKGKFLRKHSAKNNGQIAQTLMDFREYPEEWKTYLSWFRTLPLFIEFKDFRVIHACWDKKLTDFIRNKYRMMLTDELLELASKKDTLEFIAIETLLKGKEVKLPIGKNNIYVDKDKHKRKSIRYKWWLNLENQTYREIAVNYELQVPNTAVPSNQLKGHLPYATENRPIFFGHYWKKGKPQIQLPNVCCLDYSIAKKNKLVAYRFDGERTLKNENFVSVECSKKDLNLAH